MGIKSIALVASTLALSTSVNAAFIFTDVSLTTNSVTFTIDGDMSGYDRLTSQGDKFSIRYDSSLIDPNFALKFQPWTANSWSSDVFDNGTIYDSGNTGDFTSNGVTDVYTWSQYDSDLGTAVATNRTITILMADNWALAGADGALEFLWGDGNSIFDTPTVLGSATLTVGGAPVSGDPISTVPVPAALWLFGSGLLGLVGVARRKNA